MLRNIIKEIDVHTLSVLDRDLQSKVPPVTIGKTAFPVSIKKTSISELMTPPLYEALQQIMIYATHAHEKEEKERTPASEIIRNQISEELSVSDTKTIAEMAIRLEEFILFLKQLGRQFPRSTMTNANNVTYNLDEIIESYNAILEIFRDVTLSVYAKKMQELINAKEILARWAAKYTEVALYNPAVKTKKQILESTYDRISSIRLALDDPTSLVEDYEYIKKQYDAVLVHLSTDENRIFTQQLQASGYPLIFPKVDLTKKATATEPQQLPLIEILRRQAIVNWYLQDLCDSINKLKLTNMSDKKMIGQPFNEKELSKFDARAAIVLSLPIPNPLWERYSIVRKLYDVINDLHLTPTQKNHQFNQILTENIQKLLPPQSGKSGSMFNGLRLKKNHAELFVKALGFEVSASAEATKTQESKQAPSLTHRKSSD